ncbi:MAG: hypothetical protein IPL37_15970 [Austwickia sp.]|nr:hypothetical protein [Austwickia sp.]
MTRTQTSQPSSQRPRLDQHLDTVLRDLDPGGQLDDAARIRADAALERILATPPMPPTTRSVRRGRRALWLIPAAGVSALAAVVVIPAMTGSDAPAYASWSKIPSPVPAADLEAATTACQEALREDERRAVDIPAEHRPDVRADTAKVVLSERRGTYVFVALATDSGAELSCLRDAEGSMGASGSSPSVGGPKPATLAPDQVEASGPGYSGGPEGAFALLQGRVGGNVGAITVHAKGPDGDLAVEATVAGGRFAAWWPVRSDAVADPTRTNRSALAFTLDVRLRDGSIRRNAPVSGVPPVPAAPGPREVGQITRGGGAGPDGESAFVGARSAPRSPRWSCISTAMPFRRRLSRRGFTVQFPSSSGPASEPTFDLTLRDGTVLRGVKAIS